MRINGVQEEMEIDNRWIVPYNPTLSRMFECHINVELCISRIGGIKYLFKYITKGRDRVTIEFRNESGTRIVYDEIKNFQEARYVSASEAAWRLLGYTYVEREPLVVRLEVHLEGQHTVFYHEGNEVAAANRDKAGTKLTEWFEANKKYPSAKRLLYCDYGKYFTWHRKSKTWKPRQQFKVRNNNRNRAERQEESNEELNAERQNDIMNDQPEIGIPGNEREQAGNNNQGAQFLGNDQVDEEDGSQLPRQGQNRRRNSADVYDFSEEHADKETFVVSRIYTVSPREGERYYLRMLLHHVRGATSFKDIRTVDGEECPSYREACRLRGLLIDDQEWKKALDEGFRSSFVPLTELFATILIHCSPSDPANIFEEKTPILIEDFRKRKGRQNARLLATNRNAESYVLLELEKYLKDMNGKPLDEYALPLPDRTLPPLHRNQNEATEAEEVAQSWEELQQALPTLNEGQKAVFDQVVGAVEDGLSSETVEPREAPQDRFAPENFDDDEQDFSRPRCFLLNAAGGTGKTYLIKAIQNCMKVRRRKHFAVATSAVAAKLLKKGTTAHSAFKIPVPCGPGDTCYISVDSELADLIREAAIIIWDEIVMCHRHCIECVDRTLRDITEVEMPFGGKIVLFAGDFRQILPVVRGGSRAQIVNACMKSSPLYRNIKLVELTENMRLEALRQDPQASREALEFPNFLLKVGDGKVEMDAHGNIQLPPYIRKICETANLCEHIYAEIEQKYND